jgi:hypothetical protein
MKQLSLAEHMYRQDWDEKYPQDRFDGRGANYPHFVFFDGHVRAIKPTATLTSHLPLTMWHYSLSEPIDYKTQAGFDTWRQKWLDQLRAHAEYQ